jgi:hypothetical protein
MSAAYQHLALTEVEPGMILANELLDQQGQVLLPKGAVLTANTIALLPSHGIDMVGVQRPGAAPEPAPDAEAVERRLAHLFRKHDPASESDWATSMLRLYITDFRLRPGAGS